MKVRIKLKSTALQKLALVKTIKDHTGCGLTEAKFAVDDLHQTPFSAVELDITFTVLTEFRDPVRSFLASLNALGLEYDSSNLEHERDVKMMVLGLADREEYISYLSGENPFYDIDSKKVARILLERLDDEDIREIFDKIHKKD
jgi:hypothetical protein